MSSSLIPWIIRKLQSVVAHRPQLPKLTLTTGSISPRPEVIATPPPPGGEMGQRSLNASKGAASSPLQKNASEHVPFDHTRQHVAERQEPTAIKHRFANTKHNIALINDPTRGPRFTQTRKEAGHLEKSSNEPSKPSDDVDEIQEAGPDNKKAWIERKDAVSSILAGGTAMNRAHGAAETSSPKNTMPRPGQSSGLPRGSLPPSKVPIDSSKTFVGPNGTYYDEAWRWMDWRGKKQSWNWSAALTFGHWFAYRKLFRYASLYSLWLTGLASSLVSNIHVGLVIGLFICGQIAAGLYANSLYFGIFRRTVADLTENGKGDYDELLKQLAQAGGVHPTACWLMAASTMIMIATALLGSYQSRGGFQINMWPF